QRRAGVPDVPAAFRWYQDRHRAALRRRHQRWLHEHRALPDQLLAAGLHARRWRLDEWVLCQRSQDLRQARSRRQRYAHARQDQLQVQVYQLSVVSTGALIALIVVAALVILGLLVLVAKRNASTTQQKICAGCRRVMLPVWTKCLFCGWSPVAKLQFILGPMANQTLALSEEVTTIGSVAGN